LQLYLAPIRGITDCIFRTIFARHFQGFDAGLAPFIPSVKGKTVKSSHLKDILPENNIVLPVIPQIMSNNPDEFVALSRRLFDLGYVKVNWNLGCPFPQVTKKKRGSGLLPHPERIRSFLDQVIPAMPNALSIKTRLGLVSREEMEKLTPIFNDTPLAEIIIHPRTARQLYSGEVDLEGFGHFAKAMAHPVIYNGDITGKDFFCDLQRRFPEIEGWMIGRGAIANPFIAEILRGGAMDPSCMYARIKRFHDDLLASYEAVFDTGGNVVDKMKGIWLYLSSAFPHGAAFLRLIRKTRQLNQYRDLIEKMFDSPPL
jgi:tRNA-dihydrouridine synthase B